MVNIIQKYLDLCRMRNLTARKEQPMVDLNRIRRTVAIKGEQNPAKGGGDSTGTKSEACYMRNLSAAVRNINGRIWLWI